MGTPPFGKFFVCKERWAMTVKSNAKIWISHCAPKLCLSTITVFFFFFCAGRTPTYIMGMWRVSFSARNFCDMERFRVQMLLVRCRCGLRVKEKIVGLGQVWENWCKPHWGIWVDQMWVFEGCPDTSFLKLYCNFFLKMTYSNSWGRPSFC